MRQLRELVAAKGEYIALLRRQGSDSAGLNWQALSLHRNDVIREMDALIRQQHQQIQILLTSRSWRYTHPLRWLRARLRSCLLRPAAAQALPATPSPSATAAAPAADDPYPDYDRWFRLHSTQNATHDAALCASLAAAPSVGAFVVVMRAAAADQVPGVETTLETLRRQAYARWRVLLLAGPEVAPAGLAGPAVEARTCADDAAYAAAVSALAAAAPPEDYFLLLEPGDRLAPQALLLLAAEARAWPEADLLYADEDAVDGDGRHTDPFLKPGWSPDLAVSLNYVGRSCAWRAGALARAGGLRPDFLGLDNWDLLLRLAGGEGGGRVRHVPAVLFHVPRSGGDAHRARTADPARRILGESAAAAGGEAALEPIEHAPYWRLRRLLPCPCPRVSIVIPTRNGYYLLRRCLDSVFEKTRYPDFEIVIVDNDSDEAASAAYLASLGAVRNVRVVRCSGDFNYSRIVNTGVSGARGDILVLLNNDTEVVAADWLEELAAPAGRAEVGAVGALLLQRNGTIQHAGIFTGIGNGRRLPGNALAGTPEGREFQRQRFRHVQNFAAVTGACLALRREVYEEVGGLDEAMAVAFNDVDLCLRIRERGYRIVWTPHAVLYHEESSSRGADDTAEKQARFLAEAALMQRRWGSVLLDDPAANPNFAPDNARLELSWPPRTAYAAAGITS